MKRAKLVLAVSAVMLAIMMAYAAPAMAAPDRDRNDRFVSHDVEQEAESGDVDQSFRVSGGGDDSNQTVGIQGVANTGNAQNFIGVSDGFGDDFFDDGLFFCDEDFDGFCDGDRLFFDDGFFFGDFDGDGFEDFEDVGASIVVSPEQVVRSDQEVDEAASAFG